MKITLSTQAVLTLGVLSGMFFPCSLESYMAQASPMTRIQAQQGEELVVQGIVKEQSGLPAIGASVIIKGTKTGSATDANGHFSIKVHQAKGELIITSVGFQPQTVAYDVNKSLSVVLKEVTNKLDDVTVVAYGRKTTRELVSSVSSVKADELRNSVAPSIETLLQGKMAGVQITQASGSPGGGGAVVSIRGVNSLIGSNGSSNNGQPLYVIDGVPLKATDVAGTGINPLAGLDPSTIESVEVLKDASSAALYGSRASNGVIMITTKKGKSGRAEFNVNISQSISWLPETPLQVIGKGERDYPISLIKKYRLAYADENTIRLPKSYRDVYMNNGGAQYDWFWGKGERTDKAPTMVQDSLNAFYNNQTNWWKYFFRLGRVTKADLSASGGTDNVRYLMGGGFYDETGIMLNSSFRRANFLTNLDVKLTPKFDTYARIYLSYTDRSAGTDNGIAQGLTVDPKQTSSLLPGKGSDVERIALSRLQSINQKNSSYNIRLNAGLNYKITKDLRFSTSAAVDHHLLRSNIATPDYLSAWSLTESKFSASGLTMMQWESILNYDFKINNDHRFDVMLGTSFTSESMESVEARAQGGPSNSVYYISDAWPKSRIISGSFQHMQENKTDYQAQTMASIFGRLSYNYKQKYLAELAVRRDGSSVYAPAYRWGTFPSIGAGWVFTSEKFMKPLWWLSFGKLRTSWGRSGQKLDDAYLAQGTLSTYNSFLGVPGLVPSTSANSSMTWEESDQLDLGLDLYFLDQKLRMKVDYYNKYSRNLLIQTPLPGNVYFNKEAWTNAAAISNEGLEFEISADLIRKKDFSWTAQLNLARNWNLLRKAPNDMDITTKSGIQVLGRPTFGIYTYKDLGLIQNEAQIPYNYTVNGVKTPLSFGYSNNYLAGVGARNIADLNGDGTIDVSDRYYAGSTLPIAHGGLSSQIRWKDFTVDALFNFSLGRKMMNKSRYSSLAFSGLFGVILDDYRKKSVWKKDGDKTDLPAPEYAETGFIGQYDGDTDRFIENVSFLRLRQLTLSYTLPSAFTSKLRVKDARVFLTGENLFLLSNYSGVDPEIVDPYTGIDTGTQYPLDRKITLGINVKF